MTQLLLGPLLRHVGETSATVWVETSRACEVTVAGRSARTFEVAGHHYALVVLTGLAPGTSTEYDVRLDGRTVWPEPGSDLPPSRIRTLAPDAPFRLVFGSCHQPRHDRAHGTDALAVYAGRLVKQPESHWPQSLLLAGDQVYADETTTEIQRWLATRRDIRLPPGTEVADFEEYCHLYYESWSDPLLRWLMSTVPVSMLFDDHDVRDDWNISRAWQEKMRRKSWWRERLRGGFISYWIYQHIGNLGPDELARDPLFQRVTRSGVDNADTLREFADIADDEADGHKSARWSYCRNFGRVRLLAVDTRAGRILAGGRRSMVSEAEFEWIEGHARGEQDHLLIASTLPWLLPEAISHMESVNERACRRRGLRGWLAEWLRQWLDLGHWAAFRSSFDRLARLVRSVAASEDAPTTIAVLSGDVHHAYVAEAAYPEQLRSRVHQVTCSPVHNSASRLSRLAFTIGWWRPMAAVSRRWATWAGVPRLPVRWRRVSGPHFGNAIATIDVRGSEAVAFLEQARDGRLTALPPVRLSGPD
ncbi:alkaline phosphatase D family protein [Qaidamihabitans albus]|uniref:alkaline phosphatase D family protein n=1 Tax=Qaidamihabitans albus TaxID=2795733 RepID=UPI0018F26D61|nr:alkaline phosphatase D family protein [Qaidamihabitans albus]